MGLPARTCLVALAERRPSCACPIAYAQGSSIAYVSLHVGSDVALSQYSIAYVSTGSDVAYVTVSTVQTWQHSLSQYHTRVASSPLVACDSTGQA
eukprot:281407-Rhodomonas_salina.1